MAKVITKNKRAYFDYELINKYESGIVLEGWEVKSIRLGNAQINNTYVTIKNDEIFLIGMHIQKYMNSSGETERSRKLLLSKKQIIKIKKSKKVEGLTIVATVLKFSNSGYVKVDISTAKGRNKIDKRQYIKKRDAKKDMKKY
ncbi:MAG: SsrA-binding protein SmpB [Mollicutes bacterium PWAP]|nr:SsrA-binding protein SmpB [Mollicutes bacterium PWAP]